MCADELFFPVKYGHVQYSYKEEEGWGGCGRLPKAAVTAAR